MSTDAQTTQEKKQNFFPSIADVVTQTDARAEDDSAPGTAGEDEEGPGVESIPSLCMSCHEEGMTRMLLTSIPYFKEIVVMSFRCEHCGNNNTEIQSAGEIQPKGAVFTLHARTPSDLNRQIVKSPTATITISEYSLTIPAGRGNLTTVEGLLSDTIRDLAMNQPVRRVMDPETAGKIDVMLGSLRDILGREGDEDEEDDGGVGRDEEEDEEKYRQERDARREREAGQTEEEKDRIRAETFKPFTLTVDDPSGNSFLQFVDSPSDPQWLMRAYNRTLEQNIELGLVARPDGDAETESTAATGGNHKLATKEDFEQHRRKDTVERPDGTIVPDEVFSFPSTCSSCGHELETLMQQVNIPYFQNIIIMSTNCYACGYRDNEVKSGGAIPEKGKCITLKVEDEEDLSRDLLKSETCGLTIPEIDLVLQPGTLGGRFTTLEGLLNEVYEELSTKVFRTGDSATSGVGQGTEGVQQRGQFEKFLSGLKEVMTASKPFTLILDDPVSNSYLQNLYAPDADPNMTITEYERSDEQNEELGINDMVLEGYEEKHEQEMKEQKEAEAAEANKMEA